MNAYGIERVAAMTMVERQRAAVRHRVAAALVAAALGVLVLGGGAGAAAVHAAGAAMRLAPVVVAGTYP